MRRFASAKFLKKRVFMEKMAKNYSLHWVRRCRIVIFTISLFACHSANSTPQELSQPAVQSPYFFISSNDPQLDVMPLKSTKVKVQISGMIASVVVTQNYRNEGQRPIEARYVFPGSTHAAVHGMQVQLGGRVITATLREKKQAQADYQKAKQEGKTAALLEQHLANVFQMHVANILPNDDIEVELKYTELLAFRSGLYQFVFPSLVGPRYNSPQSEHVSENWVNQPTLENGINVNTNFELTIDIETPMGLQAIYSNSHAINIKKEQARKSAHIFLQDSEKYNSNNRDFILEYSLSGKEITSGLMLYEGKDENFFLAMIDPPKTIKTNQISPREYIFVVDISGSMHGFPLNTAKTMLTELLNNLKPSDTFNVILFSGSNKMLSPQSLPATQDNINNALSIISNFKGSGSTELMPALHQVYQQAKQADVARSIILITDGYVTVEREAFELVRSHLSEANFFPFGIGSAVNRHLIEGLARAGMGQAFVITSPNQAIEEAARFRRLIESPVLTNISAKFEGIEIYDVEPPVLPDVLAERPVVMFGKWRAKQAALAAQVTIEGQTANGAYRQTVIAQKTPSASALQLLWARHRIATLSDQEDLEGSQAYAAQITALGLRYQLLTQYTSFIAIDKLVRNTDVSESISIDQPLPLPQGVGNAALGTVVPSTPEAGTFASGALVLSLLYMMARRKRRQSRRNYTS